MNRDPLADARAEGLRIEVAALGTWAQASIVAEYDRASRTIRVNAAALERMRAAGGDAAANALMGAAVAHELYHHAVAEGRRSALDAEMRAEAHARDTYGIDQRAFETMLAQ